MFELKIEKIKRSLIFKKQKKYLKTIDIKDN